MWPEVAQNSRVVSGSGQNSEVSGSNQAKTMLFLLFFSSEIVKTAGRPAISKIVVFRSGRNSPTATPLSVFYSVRQLLGLEHLKKS